MSSSCLSNCTVLSPAALIFIPPIALSSFSFILQCGQKSVIISPNHSYQCDKIIFFAVSSPCGNKNIMLTFFFLFFFFFSYSSDVGILGLCDSSSFEIIQEALSVRTTTILNVWQVLLAENHKFCSYSFAFYTLYLHDKVHVQFNQHFKLLCITDQSSILFNTTCVLHIFHKQ